MLAKAVGCGKNWANKAVCLLADFCSLIQCWVRVAGQGFFLAFVPEWQNTLLFSLSFHPKLGAIHILNRFPPFTTAYLVYIFTVLPSVRPVVLFSSSCELCGYCNVDSCSVLSLAFVSTKGNLTILFAIFSHQPNSIQSSKFDSIYPFYPVSEFDSEGQSQFNRSIQFSI
jgi:hypothetical protein